MCLAVRVAVGEASTAGDDGEHEEHIAILDLTGLPLGTPDLFAVESDGDHGHAGIELCQELVHGEPIAVSSLLLVDDDHLRYPDSWIWAGRFDPAT